MIKLVYYYTKNKTHNSPNNKSLVYVLPCLSFNHTNIFTPYILMWDKTMAPHSSSLAWKIPWTEEPARLQSMRSLRVRHG